MKTADDAGRLASWRAGKLASWQGAAVSASWLASGCVQQLSKLTASSSSPLDFDSPASSFQFQLEFLARNGIQAKTQPGRRSPSWLASGSKSLARQLASQLGKKMPFACTLPPPSALLLPIAEAQPTGWLAGRPRGKRKSCIRLLYLELGLKPKTSN